jgi:malate synthase
LADYELVSGIEIDRGLRRFIEQDVLPGTGIEADAFWAGLETILRELTPENKRLLARRDELQALIDARNESLDGRAPNPAEEEALLRSIFYLVDSPAQFAIGTTNVDPEIAQIAGPQLVVPVNNARYALNAVNARWGSLYDALYGTDALGDLPSSGGYDVERGARVIAWGRAFLDEIAPLTGGSHADVGGYRVEHGRLVTDRGGLADPSLLAGSREGSILLRHHNLHVEIVIDPDHPIGSTDQAGVADIRLESAITAIMDCEDSVAAVEAEEKIGVYRNWLGLMKGDLSASFDKGGQRVERRAEPDRSFTAPDGGTLTLKGRSLLFIRNVGHLMTNPMIRVDGEEAFEGIADAVFTSLIALHDLRGARANSPTGSIYIVKPKMHGPRSGLRQPSVRPGRGSARPPPSYDQDRRDGRGAPHQRQSGRGDPRGTRPRRLHQHRLSRPHRRRNPYVDEAGPDDPEGRNEGRDLAEGL